MFQDARISERLTDTQKLVLRMYEKDGSISLRALAKRIVKPNKTMLGRWVIWLEENQYITRIGNGTNKQVFLTEKGRRAAK